jgi:succinylarginine dihydrolase
MLTEINIDGMIGPTHHYGGLGIGNVASLMHRNQVSNPRQAALEGLAKAKLISEMGIPQYIWLPPTRPNRQLLNALGFQGTLSEQIRESYETSPEVLSAAFSNAFMWAANSATVTPAVDAHDNRYHFTPANLISSLHRASEASERRSDIQNMFADPDQHVIHDPLPSIHPLRDEGAANHMRLSDPSGDIGFNIFVFGEDSQLSEHSRIAEARLSQLSKPNFMARHSRAASEAIARRHGLNPETTFFLHQHPKAISAGVFHNDVIATSHEGLLIHHEDAFLDSDEELDRLEATFQERVGKPLLRIVISNRQLSLSDAVQSYLFNSQLVSPRLRPGGRDATGPRMVMVCPRQCQAIESANRVLQELLASTTNPIDEIRYVSLGQSMAGGGGPACLRLRVPADERTMKQLPETGRMNSRLFDALSTIVEQLYPHEVTLASFTDNRFIKHLEAIELAIQQAFYAAT